MEKNGLDLLQEQTQQLLREVTRGSTASEPPRRRLVRCSQRPKPVEDGVSKEDAVMELPPSCELCGAEHIAPITAAFTMLRGQWMINKTAGGAVFVLDPNLRMNVVQLENGQLALAFPQYQAHSDAIAHVEGACLEQVMQWAPEMFVESNFEEDEP